MTSEEKRITKECTVYIDESGDLGVNRGTQWFVLTAVVVDMEDEPAIRQTIMSLRSHLNVNCIHMRTIKDFSRKRFIVRELSKHNFTYMNILFDTHKFDLNKMTSERIAYNYICRYLIERVSWLLRDTNRIGNIVLSSRGTSKDGELIDYIKSKLMNYEFNNVSKCFASIKSYSAPSRDLLQLADVCATTMFWSYEKNGYGFITPCFARQLKKKLYSRNGQIMSYGIKYFSDEMKPDTDYFSGSKVCDII
ncbi:MAG: DUF3800 domain-containing protein [Clostridiales bacterium]|nr:DUF3800 domain-containing protein [Clostridiales bacterium]